MAIPPKATKETKLINLDAMCADQRRLYDSLGDRGKAEYLGFGSHGRPDFDVPGFNKTKNEKMLEKGNAFVVVGLDRNAGPDTGFGGQNATHCGAIDLVAGRKGWMAVSKQVQDDGRCSPVSTDSDFTLDAARVYISQKSDVDTYFRITNSKAFGPSPHPKALAAQGYTTPDDPRSAVALKADVLRLVARENIKLITRTDKHNSQGGVLGKAITRGYGIDLIAMNDFRALQPMVKGENLRILLTVMCKTIGEIISTFTTYVSETRKIHTAVIKHNHLENFFGLPCAPDFQGLIPDGINVLINNITNVDVGSMSMQQKWNQITMEYLSQAGVETLDANQQSKSILSPLNRNN
tara:strand:- start:9737 stop:10789 length:1053 start_codon:yes stop_codon:yes gene_type:complete